MVTKKQCEDLMDRLAVNAVGAEYLILTDNGGTEEDRSSPSCHDLAKMVLRGMLHEYENTQATGEHATHGNVTYFTTYNNYRYIFNSFTRPPIYLGRCLRVLRDLAPIDWSFTSCEVLRLWGKCDFESSLQAIFAGIEWEEVGALCPSNNEGCAVYHTIQSAKPSPAAELFYFLIDIGL